MKRDFEKFLKQHRDYRRYFRNLKAYNGDAWESVYNVGGVSGQADYE